MVIEKVQCYINLARNKVINSSIIPALKNYCLKPFCTQEDGNTLARGGSSLILSCGNTQIEAGVSDQIGDADKTK